MKLNTKNILILLLILSMTLSVLSACGGSKNTNSGGNTPTATTPTTPPVNTEIPDQIVETPVSITCISGTPACYTFDGNTLTFTRVSADTVYAISGTLKGNIVIDTGDNYKFYLEMHGFTLLTNSGTPIVAYSGSEVEVKAKNGYKNYIYDNREFLEGEYAISSEVDLEIAGKGELEIISKNNGGIYTKDDLQVKNLTLSIICKTNALKGNDGVEMLDANTVLISKNGDCIKTTNSHLNTTTGNQKGSIYISGGTHFIYAACDGLDSSYNVVVENSATTEAFVGIYTDRYSQYSEDVTVVSKEKLYLRTITNAYKYSVLYRNSQTNEYKWVNVSNNYETAGGGRPGSSSYYYYSFEKLSGYDKISVYMYDSTQEQGQADNYYACSTEKSINDAYDTLKLTNRNSSLSIDWTNYGTSSYPGGMGGMQEGNKDKGEYSTKGIKAANEILINSGNVNIESYDDAIHANNDGGTLENGENPTGHVSISGGNVVISSNDDGIHADGNLYIKGGNVDIKKAYEGVEGVYVTVSGGSLSVVTTDDGMNATATSGAAFTISGGRVYIYAGGDGIDSNSRTSKGSIAFSGGETVVISTSRGNSAIDSEGGYNHTGGRVLAMSPTGAMTNEMTDGNTTGRTIKSSISLSAGGYLVVDNALTVKMPIGMSAYVVYLGSSSANISSASSSSATLDTNGVYWSK